MASNKDLKLSDLRAWAERYNVNCTDMELQTMADDLRSLRALSPSSDDKAGIDLSKCPKCGGEADNGHDRCIPPSAYYCTRCSDEAVSEQEPVFPQLPKPIYQHPALGGLFDRLQMHQYGVKLFDMASTHTDSNAPIDEKESEQTFLHLSRELISALKRLSFAAQTASGTAGRDDDLVSAIAQAEKALSLAAVSRAIDSAEATSRLASQVPPGCKIVPFEPTPAMIKSGMSWLSNWQHMRTTDKVSVLTEAYSHMVAAAPLPPNHKDEKNEN